MNNEEILVDLHKIVKAEQIISDHETLYDASADRYKKYAKVRKVLNVPMPTAIVYPRSVEEVQKLLCFCNEYGINIIPRSGKTATEGGLENWREQSLVIDGSQMNRIISIDSYNMQASVEAGVPLQVLEDEVRKIGLTTGHSPQSKPVAQYGGLVATRSIGQFSTLYGGIEDMVVGLECVFPNGKICHIKDVPRRSGGPDIRHIAIGNEGSLCYITKVTVKLFRYYPENHSFHGYLIKDVETGIKILREVITAGFRPSVARVYSEEDAHQHFSHFHNGKCVLIFLSEGPKGIVESCNACIHAAIDTFQQGVITRVEDALISDWFNNLNWSQKTIDEEFRHMKESPEHSGFTTEISGTWDSIIKIYNNVMARVQKEFDRAHDLTMLGGHSSHSYQNGTNMYFVYNYKIHCAPEDEMRIYHHPIQRIIVEETLKEGGSMCHHHGIGKWRSEWTEQEHGSAYYMLKSLKDIFDPKDTMNHGCIFPDYDDLKKFE